MKEYNSNFQQKMGIGLSYLNMALQIIISLVFTPFMLRILGQSEYGLYSLSSSTISYLSLITLGIGGAYTRFYIREKVVNNEQEIKKINGMYLIIYLISSIVCFLLGTRLVLNIDSIFTSLTITERNTTKVLMLLLTINLAISFPCSLFSSYITANEKFIFQRLLAVIKTISSPLLVIPILLSGAGAIGYTVVTVIVNISIEMFSFFYALLKLNMKFTFKGLHFSTFKSIALFSIFIFLNQIINQINSNMGSFLLGIYQGSLAVAVYGIAMQITNYFTTFSTVISSVYAPKVNRLVATNVDNREITEMMTKVGKTQFVIIMLVLTGLIFFGKKFILLWVGNEYMEAYYIILLLCIPMSIPLIQNVGIEIQTAMNKHQVRSIAYLIMAVINIFISIPCIKKYGTIGAAMGTCLSYVLCNILFMNIYYHKYLKLDMIYFWKGIGKFFPSLIIPMCLGIIFNKMGNTSYSWNSLIFYITIYCILYVLCIFLFGLKKEKKKVVYNQILKLSKKFK